MINDVSIVQGIWRIFWINHKALELSSSIFLFLLAFMWLSIFNTFKHYEHSIQDNLLYIYIYIYVCVCIYIYKICLYSFFIWLHPWYMEGPSPGIKSELPQRQHWIFNPLHHSRNSSKIHFKVKK